MPAPVKPVIPFSVVESIDIRVGRIRAVEDLPASRKLVRLAVPEAEVPDGTRAG